jgi:hypothetical protein
VRQGGSGTASGRWAVDGGGAEEDDAGLSEEELRGEGGRREVKGGGGRREVGVELTRGGWRGGCLLAQAHGRSHVRVTLYHLLGSCSVQPPHNGNSSARWVNTARPRRSGPFIKRGEEER